jgi:hypothetical protein
MNFNFLTEFVSHHQAEFKAAGVGLVFAVGDALVSLADNNQHVSVSAALAAGGGAAFFYLKALYHAKRAEVISEALVQATLPQNPVQTQAAAPASPTAGGEAK